MPVLTASWEPSDSDMARVVRAAAFFGMDLQTFLNEAFVAGVYHVESKKIVAEGKLGPQEVIDDSDDVPF